MRTKILAGVILSSVIAVLLLLGAALIVPRLIDSEIVKAKIRSEFLAKVGIDIGFSQIDIAAFPVPQVNVYDAVFILPQKFRGSAEAIKVYPKILPLLIGDLNFKELLIQEPVFATTLPSALKEKQPRAEPPAVRQLVQDIVSSVTALPVVVDSHIHNGSLMLVDKDKEISVLRNLEAHLTNVASKAQLEVTGTSDIAKSASLSGWIDTEEMVGGLEGRITKLQPQTISNLLFSDAPIRAKGVGADLRINFSISGPGQMRLALDAEAPRLSLGYERNRIDVERVRLKGSIAVDNISVTASLAELAVAYPQMCFSGHLTSALDDAQLRLELEGRDIDISEAREVALSAAENNRIVRALFEVMRAGAVPSINLTAEGRDFSDLAAPDNLGIRGQIRQGSVKIPRVELALSDASGEVVLSQGILEARNLQARSAKSTAQNGELHLDLGAAGNPFELKADVRADLSQLPPLLERLIDDPQFQDQIARFEQLHGNAKAKLTLNKPQEGVQVKASDIQLTATDPSLPFPLQITDGAFSYDQARITVEKLSGSLGKCNFSGLSGGLDLHGRRNLEMTSGQARIELEEAVPWLSSFRDTQGIVKHYGGGNGVITLSNINLKGPVSELQGAYFKVAGQVENLALKDLPKDPGALRIISGKFEADPQTFSYSDGRLRLMDTTLNLSGTHARYLKRLTEDVRLTMEGQVGPQSIQWLSNVLGAPSWLRLRPLTLSASHITYRTNAEKMLSADLELQDDLAVSTDIVLDAEELQVKKLSIQDESSQATIGLGIRNKVVGFSFSGNLHNETFEQLLKENDLLGGWVAGHIRGQIPTQALSKLRVEGELKGRGISVPWHNRPPLTINSFVMNGEAERLFIDWADLAWRDTELHLSGRIEPHSRTGLQIDMNIAADTVNLNHLTQALGANESNKQESTAATSLLPPVQGKIRFKADRFAFGDFTWAPLQADIKVSHGGAALALKEATLCGISMPGTVTVSRGLFEFDIEAKAKDQLLNRALGCLAEKYVKMTGRYALEGHFRGKGAAKNLLKSATGQVQLTAKDGRIYRDIVLLNVLKFLNTSELLTGRAKLEKMKTKGFHYRSVNVRAKLQNGRILFEKAVIDSHPLVVTGSGDNDLLDRRLKLDLLVAPLVTLDRVLEEIPVVGGALGTLDTIPLTLQGTYDRIHVYLLSPQAVGHELQELMRETVKGPIKLIHGGGKAEPKGRAYP